MKNAYFHRMMTGLVLAGVSAALLCAAETSFIGIESATDSNGYFHYTLHSNTATYRLGGESNSLSVALPCRALVAVEDVPGWVWQTTSTHSIIWRYTGTAPCVIGEAGITFAYTSAWHASVVYTGISRTSDFPAARIEGVVYDSMHKRIARHDAEDGEAWAGNIVCIEHVAAQGPVVPESASSVAVLAGAFVARRKVCAKEAA